MVQLEVVRAITALKHQYTCQRYEPGQWKSPEKEVFCIKVKACMFPKTKDTIKDTQSYGD